MKKNKSKKVIQLPTTPENYIKTRARNLPVGKCFINEGWAETGFASIVVSRNHINGNYTFAVYLVDLFCLGVKDTFYDFNVNTEFTDLLDKLKSQQQMEEIDYPLAHNIIYGGVEYAEDLGFKPHKNFEVSQFVLEEDDERVELIDVQFGLNGKPAVLFGKEKHPANTIATLEHTVGKGNFIVMNEEDFDDNENDDYEEDTWEEDDDEELSLDDIADIMEGKKKTSPRKFAAIVFALYMKQRSPQESSEIFEILNTTEKWETEDEPEEPFCLNEENELIYDTLYEKIEENAANAIHEIQAQISKHPDEYQFYSLLTLAYYTINDTDKYDESVILTYQKFPYNIFAFTNYILIMIAKFNFDELKEVIGDKFIFHHFFPNKQKICYEEFVALAATLFTFFSEVTREFHKAIAFAMSLSSFVFYGDEKEKANEILMSATEIMFSEIKTEDSFDDRISKNPLRVV
jgi:hypothetical protein